MNLQDQLLAIEEQLWTGGEPAYHEHVDEHCLIAFTEMTGTFTRSEIAATVKDGARWTDLKMDVQGTVQPAQDVAMITYRASARLAERQYTALVSSGYVHRGGQWKLMFHQQTPLAE